jgi:hypothetical protein
MGDSTKGEPQRKGLRSDHKQSYWGTTTSAQWSEVKPSISRGLKTHQSTSFKGIIGTSAKYSGHWMKRIKNFAKLSPLLSGLCWFCRCSQTAAREGERDNVQKERIYSTLQHGIDRTSDQNNYTRFLGFQSEVIGFARAHCEKLQWLLKKEFIIDRHFESLRVGICLYFYLTTLMDSLTGYNILTWKSQDR